MKKETSKMELDLAPNGIPIFKVQSKGKFFGPAGPDGTRENSCHLVFVCPKCKTKISHGGGKHDKIGDGDGHRVSHCPCWPNGYYIKEV